MRPTNCPGKEVKVMESDESDMSAFERALIRNTITQNEAMTRSFQMMMTLVMVVFVIVAAIHILEKFL